MTKGEEFQQELCGEDYNKDEIDPVEDVLCLIGLIIRFHHHRDHVQTDEDHDGDVKNLLCHKVKHHALDLILQGEKNGTGQRKLKMTVESHGGGAWL